MPTIGREVSLYFHIPFCSKKCPYCHFFVLPNEERYKTPFLTALLQEWALRLPQLQGKRVVSIYFGGGTPTKLAPDQYALLLDALFHSGIEIAPDCEITLEANPEDVTLPLMQRFSSLGINRVSLGVQSLFDADLTLLGRSHNASASMRAIHTTYRAGITNISIDLLFELPYQTLSTFERSLAALKELPFTHLSLYNLTFEPHTVFFKKRGALEATLPPDEERLSMLESALAALSDLGLERYEISAFARPGYPSRHNSGYWTARPFLGFGPSAFSYWEGARFSNTTRFNHYLDLLKEGQLPVAFTETLPYPSHLQELLAVRLRLVEGVDLVAFTARHGVLPQSVRNSVEKLIEQGLLIRGGDNLRLSPRGQLFYDTVASELI
jgi:oxygen-independent coproporphyrinogen-3 oxidase